MDRILVLSRGVHACAKDAHSGTKAIVTHGLSFEGSKAYAERCGIPLVQAGELFRASPQAIRYSATRRIVRERGVTLYHPLNQVWVDQSSCPLARGSASALFTAFVLARALGVSTIDCRAERHGEDIVMNPLLEREFRTSNISFRHLT